uniref:PX domain-containing protein n=1 Tax=Globisporangium ultimum (strain ATCC 200006 / CBS 805.95 / DAOM BR144) TaxID=431595 RepID=K3WE20_GLOUD
MSAATMSQAANKVEKSKQQYDTCMAQLQLVTEPRQPLPTARLQLSALSPIQAQRLMPVAMEPEQRIAAVAPLEFLSTIQRIEINHIQVRDGVTYYVLDVYLYHFTTRLPANLKNPQRAALHSSPLKANKPDYQVERRFSAFCQLRDEVYEMPRSFAKLSANPEQRKLMLTEFINDFLRMAQNKEQQSRKCIPEDIVPHLLESFMRDYDIPAITSQQTC